jgi:hypothetical protein
MIEQSPKILILVFETGDELAGGLFQFPMPRHFPPAGWTTVRLVSGDIPCQPLLRVREGSRLQ